MLFARGERERRERRWQEIKKQNKKTNRVDSPQLKWATSLWPWLIHVDGPVTEERGWRRVKNGLMRGYTEAGVHMAPEAPARPGWQKGPLPSIRPLLKPLWEFCFAVPLSSAEPLTFSQAGSGMCLLHTNTHGECLHPRWLVIIVIADAKNVVQLSNPAWSVNTLWHLKFHVCRLGSAA